MNFAGFFSGIADEAAKDIDGQIRAHQELGWKHIEIRNISGKNLTDLPEVQFHDVRKKIEAAGLQVSCFASQLANWSRPISGDFELDVQELRRALPRLRALRTPFIRCMSYPNAAPPWEEGRWRKEVIRRLKVLAQMAEGGGVTLVHENCNGWGGLGPSQSMDLLAEVGLSSLQLLFDTGNPAQYSQDSWEYYQGVRDRVVYVHIKDYFQPKSKGDERACYPGEGCGHVREILRDLISRGYRGGISIEPHLAAVIHRQQDIQDPQVAFRSYVEYGRRLEKLVAEL
ncbi:MAG: sugar phosphate isomerase/epimerase [Planctomycetes bacterium]|nr:sugar phosphate isomerase/epimerase [Planctomycetota bacterium]